MSHMFSNTQVVLPNFIYPRLDHWCHIHRVHNQSKAHRKYISIPYDQKKDNYESCVSFDLPWHNYSQDDFTNWNWTGVDQSTVETVECQSGWEYDRSVFISTATSEWDLVCDKAWIYEVLSPLYLAGLFVGSLVSGPLSDNLGRMRTMLFGMTVTLLCALGSAFAINEWMFMVSRFILALSSRFTGICSVVVGMEIITPEYRSMTVCAARIVFSSGALVVTGAAYFIKDFRTLQLALLVPLVASFSLKWLIPESPRWLMSKGRKAEARTSILTLARRSGTTVPDVLLDKYTRQESVYNGKSNNTASVKDLFRVPTLLRWTLVLGFIKVSVQFVYFAVTMNMGSLFGDIYLNTMLAAITEIPAGIILTYCLHIYGRKKPLLILLVLLTLGGFVSMGLLIADVYPIANTVTMILMRCAASGGATAATSLSGELFPSAMRQTAVSISSAVSSLFAIFAPYAGGPMTLFWAPLPSLVFGVLNLLAAILCLFIPDTLGKAMPETIEEALNLGRLSKTMSQEAQDHTSTVVVNGLEKNGKISVLTGPGVEAGETFYPFSPNGARLNWAFEEDFNIRL